jgi:hypothetical protein
MATRANDRERLVYVGRPPPSAEFYSRGKAVSVPDVAALAPLLDAEAAGYLAIRSGDLARVMAATGEQLVPMGEFGDYRLLRKSSR